MGKSALQCLPGRSLQWGTPAGLPDEERVPPTLGKEASVLFCGNYYVLSPRLNSRLYQGHALYLLAGHSDYSGNLMDSPDQLPTNFSGFQASITHSNILSMAIRKPPSQQEPAPAPAPTPAPAPVPSFQIPADLIFPSTHAAFFSATHDSHAYADDEKLLDSKEGDADASTEVGPESLLDLDDAALGISNMDTDDHQEFPTPTEAYLKKPPISDADAVKMAKKGARKK